MRRRTTWLTQEIITDDIARGFRLRGGLLRVLLGIGLVRVGPSEGEEPVAVVAAAEDAADAEDED